MSAPSLFGFVYTTNSAIVIGKFIITVITIIILTFTSMMVVFFMVFVAMMVVMVMDEVIVVLMAFLVRMISTMVLTRAEIVRFNVAPVFEVWRVVGMRASGVFFDVFSVFQFAKRVLF